MCGISAIVDGPAAGVGSVGDLLRMHETLAHRGPDGEGFLFVDSARQACALGRPPSPAEAAAMRPVVAIAFRRLSIQDPRSEANQPLQHSAARRWIVFNGEIYNFRELRQLLEAEGHVFRTRGDSEVALAAYERWGTACFERFRGMWALLIVDLERAVLVGSRDRLGIKPLFYAEDGGRLLFASEPKAIAGVHRGGRRVRAARLTDFLRSSPSQVSAFSLFEDVRLVPAATFFEIDLLGGPPAAPAFRQFWDLADHVAREPAPSFEEARDEFAGLLRSAVGEHLIADVRVGSLLSGGLDSSMLTRLMTLGWADRPGAAPVFSLVFDDPEMDESRYIDAVLALGGTEGRRVRLGPNQAWDLIDEVTLAYGEPLLGHYLLAYYHLLRSVRAHGVTVVLDGQGADELLGGYNPLEAAALRERLSRGQWREFFRELRVLASQPQHTWWSVLRSHVLGPWKREFQARVGGRPGERRYEWLSEETPSGPDRGSEPVPGDRGRDRSLYNQMAYRLTRYTNLPYLLLFLDRLSMAHGVELRVPYLDHRLVEFCFQMPARHKVAGGERKRLLRHLARDYLPPLVTERTFKMGISSNLRWLPQRAAHRDALRDMVASPTLRELPVLRPAPLASFVDDYLTGRHDDALAVWRLYSAWRWLEAFRPVLLPGAS